MLGRVEDGGPEPVGVKGLADGFRFMIWRSFWEPEALLPLLELEPIDAIILSLRALPRLRRTLLIKPVLYSCVEVGEFSLLLPEFAR